MMVAAAVVVGATEVVAGGEVLAAIQESFLPPEGQGLSTSKSQKRLLFLDLSLDRLIFDAAAEVETTLLCATFS